MHSSQGKQGDYLRCRESPGLHESPKTGPCPTVSRKAQCHLLDYRNVYYSVKSQMHFYLQKIAGGEAGARGHRKSPLILWGIAWGLNSRIQFTVSVSDAVCVRVPLFVEAVPVTVTV